MDEYLTTKEAAQYLGGDVGFRTIVRWIHEGHLRAFRRPSKRGHFKILKSDLDNILREVNPNANER
jgi:excisionase family DNA binding protein